ncbi:MAG: allose kinase [Lachnospiraceae bacterium]|nr:allose kinase [Lachnospiraceae bacterium]
MDKKEYVLGMDIGGTNFRMGLVNRSLATAHVEVRKSADIYGTGNTVEAFAACIRDYVERCADTGRIVKIAVGCPSVVDKKRRMLYSSTNFPGLEGFDLVGELEKRVDFPVCIDHDAYYLLAYDMRQYNMGTTGTAVGCYFGTGLGNAMYIDGKPYVGKNGTACELGHLPIPLNEYPCSCGNSGCIEMFSCGKALERIAAEHYSGTFIGDLFLKHGEDKLLKDFIEYMSAAISAEVNILDPDVVFVGGGIVQMQGFPKELLRERVIAHARKPYPAQNLNLVYSKSGPENGIIGAAIRAFQELDAEG